MFSSIAEMVEKAETQNTSLYQVVLQVEIERSGQTEEAIRARLQTRLEVMRRSVDAGLNQPMHSVSGMSGGDAHRLWGWQADQKTLSGPILSRAVARAMAVGEVNAGMGCIVATPTAGAAGVLPALLLSLQEAYTLSDKQLVDSLLTAGGIGSVIARRASISGAAAGCQAEVGSAAAMAAGAAVELMGGTPRQSAQAVAIALTNMLGLVCDPVAGLVEVPCVKRNAGGVAQAIVAVDLSLAGIESLIPADEVIDAMAAIGRRMDERLKETAQGGLAATPTGKAWAIRLH